MANGTTAAVKEFLNQNPKWLGNKQGFYPAVTAHLRKKGLKIADSESIYYAIRRKLRNEKQRLKTRTPNFTNHIKDIKVIPTKDVKVVATKEQPPKTSSKIDDNHASLILFALAQKVDGGVDKLISLLNGSVKVLSKVENLFNEFSNE